MTDQEHMGMEHQRYPENTERQWLMDMLTQTREVAFIKGTFQTKVAANSFSKLTHSKLTNWAKGGSGGRHWRSSIA